MFENNKKTLFSLKNKHRSRFDIIQGREIYGLL